jgi:hypothetical protein
MPHIIDGPQPTNRRTGRRAAAVIAAAVPLVPAAAVALPFARPLEVDLGKEQWVVQAGLMRNPDAPEGDCPQGYSSRVSEGVACGPGNCIPFEYATWTLRCGEVYYRLSRRR